MNDGPVLKDVVLVGAGHAHVAVLRSFGMKPMPGVRLTLITREVETPYSGMLPGLVAGVYSFDEAHIDTGPLTRFAKARLYSDEVIGIDPTARQVLCRDRPPVPYDILSIDIGSRPTTGAVPGATDHAIPVKPIDGFLPRFERLRADVIARKGKAHVAVVGGGAAGVELMLALAHRLRRDVAVTGGDPSTLAFTLVAGSADILPAFPSAMRRALRQVLAARGILVRTGVPVVGVSEDRIDMASGEAIATDHVLWTTQVAPASWLAQTGLALSPDGFLRIDETLRAIGHDDIFAAGDITAFDPRPLPRSGVYAVRAGPVIARNIRARLTGRPLSKFSPQRQVLYLLSTSDGRAIGTRNGLTFSGAWVWRWKDRIDRRFMARFNALPDMPLPHAGVVSPLADREAVAAIAAGAMRCGGCGAKVGVDALSRVLGDLDPLRRDDVIVGLDAPDDAAVVDTGGPDLSVHSVDYFRAIVDDPFTFGKIAANHALGDLFAMGATPQSALAIATVPYGLERQVEADLRAMMQGANSILKEAGCALVGGHTSEGEELALGFAVNGLAPRHVLRKGGMRPGEVLVLTKPIGTGTILAAHMRGKARARWVMAALDHMVVSARRGSEILRAHGASAATDVTGFGLIGHLVEMTRASDVDATLYLGDIPVLDGARETIAAGIVSSLQSQNVRLCRAIRDAAAATRWPDYALLFDPQTAGGLLASVPAARAASCIEALRGAGYAHASMIGTIDARGEATESIRILETRPPTTAPTTAHLEKPQQDSAVSHHAGF